MAEDHTDQYLDCEVLRVQVKTYRVSHLPVQPLIVIWCVIAFGCGVSVVPGRCLRPSVEVWGAALACASSAAQAKTALKTLPAATPIVIPRGSASETTFSPSGDGYVTVQQGDANVVVRVDFRTNRVVWRSRIGDSLFLAPLPPAFSSRDNLLFAVAGNSMVSALDPLTGKPRWTFQPADLVERMSPEIATAPSTAKARDGSVYYCALGSLVVLEASTGQPQWHKPVGASGTGCSPAVGDNAVFVTTDRGTTAFRRSDGLALWENKEARGGDRSPLLDEPSCRLYIPVSEVGLYCLSTDKGRTIWRTDMRGEILSNLSQPLSHVLVVKASRRSVGRLQGVSVASGKLIWEGGLTDGHGAPCGYAGIVYAARLPKLLAFKVGRTEPLWRMPLGLGVSSSSPSVGPNGEIVVHDGSSLLWVLRQPRVE